MALTLLVFHKGLMAGLFSKHEGRDVGELLMCMNLLLMGLASFAMFCFSVSTSCYYVDVCVSKRDECEAHLKGVGL